MLGTRWNIKPPLGYEIDRDHHLARGLIFFAPLWEGSGPAAYDLVTGTALAINAGPSWSSGSSAGLLFNANNRCVQAAGPAVAPGRAAVLDRDWVPARRDARRDLPRCSSAPPTRRPACRPIMGWRSSTTTRTRTSPSNVNIERHVPGRRVERGRRRSGRTTCCRARSRTAPQTLLPERHSRSGPAPLSGTIGYGSSPWIAIGASSIFARNPNILAYWGAMWNRTLAPAEHAALAANIWQIFAAQADPGRLPLRIRLAVILRGHAGQYPEQPSGQYHDRAGRLLYELDRRDDLHDLGRAGRVAGQPDGRQPHSGHPGPDDRLRHRHPDDLGRDRLDDRSRSVPPRCRSRRPARSRPGPTPPP